MLISDIDLLKKYIPTVMAGDFDRYNTYLQTADEYLIRELIGQTIYNLVNAPDPPAEDPPVEDQPEIDTKFRDLCRCVVAHKGYMDAIPFLDLVETENGFAVTSNPNMAPASQQRVAALVKGVELRLSDAIELLLAYLEENTSYYESWKDAKIYTVNHDSYIFTLTQFRRYARYDASRMEWIKDISKVTRAIRLLIEPVISAELSKTIITELQDDNLSEDNKKIIEDLRFCLAAFVTGDQANGFSLLYRVRNFLLANVEKYEAFKNSDVYAAYLAETSGFSTDQTIASFGI